MPWIPSHISKYCIAKFFSEEGAHMYSMNAKSHPYLMYLCCMWAPPSIAVIQQMRKRDRNAWRNDCRDHHIHINCTTSIVQSLVMEVLPQFCLNNYSGYEARLSTSIWHSRPHTTMYARLTHMLWHLTISCKRTLPSFVSLMSPAPDTSLQKQLQHTHTL